MRIATNRVQQAKVGLHCIQGFLIFIVAVLMIAVFTKPGETDGRAKWYFALCFLTIPAIMYLAMFPQWKRSVRFANPFALTAVDFLYTIFWFSAMICIASWTSSGTKRGAEERHIDVKNRNCTTFAYGDEIKCNISKASAGFAFFLFLFFGLTTAISVWTLTRYMKGKPLPWDAAKPYHNPTINIEAQTKDAWSTDTHEINDPFAHDADSDDGTRTVRRPSQDEDEHGLLHSSNTEYGRHPGRPLSWGSERRPSDIGAPQELEDDEHARNEAHRRRSSAPYPEYESMPSTHSLQEYAATQDIGYGGHRKGNYSFSGGDGR